LGSHKHPQLPSLVCVQITLNVARSIVIHAGALLLEASMRPYRPEVGRAVGSKGERAVGEGGETAVPVFHDRSAICQDGPSLGIGWPFTFTRIPPALPVRSRIDFLAAHSLESPGLKIPW